MTWLEDYVSRWVMRYRWLIIAVTVVLVAAAASGMRYLTFLNDTRIFFSKENPQLQALEALESTYNRIDNVAFIIAPKDGNVFTRSTLSVIEKLTAELWEMPYSSRVDSISNFQHARAEKDDLIVEDLIVNAESLSDSDIEEKRNIALAEPLLVNRLLSPSGHVTSINVNVLMPRKSIDEVPEVAAYARNIITELETEHPDIAFHLTGAVMFDNAFGEAAIQDMSTLVPLMFIAILVIIGLTLRSYVGTFGTLLVIFFSMLTALGLAGWMGYAINPASSNAPTIILVLAVADSVHLLSTTYQQLRLGRSRVNAVSESLRINLQPVFLTSATTAIGFLTMNFSDAPPFRDLGNIVAMGVMAAFFYSVLFLPALLAVLPVKVKEGRMHSDPACGSCDRLAGLVIRNRTTVFRVSLAVCIVLIAGMLRIELNDNWVKYFDERFAIRRAADFVSENISGFDIIEYSLPSGEAGGINEPEYLRRVERFAEWMRSQPGVVHVNTMTDTYKRLNKNMHGDNDAYYTIPDKRELAAQYLLLYEMSLPFGLDLNNMIDVDKSATRMIVMFNEITAKELRGMEKKARAWMKANTPELYTYGSGLSIIWAYISQRNINSMLGASTLALILISMLLVCALKSYRIGMLSLIPNLFPAFMAFGLWGLMVGQVGLGLSVVVAMTLGIVVDDTVHFISKYLRARREERLSPEDAVRYAFNTVGTAMWVTTVALVGGFLVLTYSGFKMNAEMGLLTAITITIALVMDFFFLPVLLMKFDGQKDQKIR